jgi:cytochrome b561
MSAFEHSFDALHWITFALICIPYFAAKMEK